MSISFTKKSKLNELRVTHLALPGVKGVPTAVAVCVLNFRSPSHTPADFPENELDQPPAENLEMRSAGRLLDNEQPLDCRKPRQVEG
jgi:hypothetical protein